MTETEQHFLRSSANAADPALLASLPQPKERNADAEDDSEVVSTKKIRPIKGVIVDCVKETSDTWTHYISVGNDRNYIAGQFVSIDPHQFPELSESIAYLEHKKGRKEVIRAYSMASAPWEPHVMLTIKPERFHPEEGDYLPLLSPFLASDILRGREITLMGYTGAYILPPNHAELTDEVLHFVAGSGVVPNFALLKDELVQNRNPGVFHTMINVNKTAADIIYRRELDELAATYKNRFKLVNLLTRESPEKYGTNYAAGRPTFELVQSLVKDPQNVFVFACGAAISKWARKLAKEKGVEPTPKFMESVGEIVQKLGVDRKRFKREVYG